MSKVLVSYKFEESDEVLEDLWVMRNFGTGVWNGKTYVNGFITFTLALEPEDAFFVGLNRALCETPKGWENALTKEGGVK